MKKRTRRKTSWLDELQAAGYKRPLAIFRFGLDEWGSILASKDDTDRFTATYPHEALEKVRPPTACLIFTEEPDGSDACYFARLSARRAASTLDTWLKIEDAQPIRPSTEAVLHELVSERTFGTNLRNRLEQTGAVVALSRDAVLCQL